MRRVRERHYPILGHISVFLAGAMFIGCAAESEPLPSGEASPAPDPGAMPGADGDMPGAAGDPGVSPGDPGAGPGMGGPGAGPGEGPGVSCESGPVGGRAPMRRLTRGEYNNTVQDLLGTTLRVADGFVPEREQNGFLNSGDAVFFEELLIQNYMNGAEELAADARARGVFKLDCEATGAECAQTFIQDFGRRAFRRPLNEVEVQDYLAVFEMGVVEEENSFEGGLEWVVQRMLQSVNFLYRIEPLPADFVPGTKTVKLSDHAVASRLSYLLFQTTPDEELLAAADNGLLSTPEQVGTQVQRLMSEDRFVSTLALFHRQWLSYGRLDAKLRPIEPAWDGALQDALNEEADLFISELFKTGGTVADLFTAEFSMLNDQVAAFYGVPAPAQPGFQRVEGLPNRAGILTMASFLGSLATNDQSNPVKRGVVVRERILCQHLPAPPDAVMPPDVAAGLSTRERFELHRSEPACAACHTLIDPIGMGFEAYDEFGRYREMDQGKPVDASGELTGAELPDGEPTTFVGVQELGAKLALSPEVSACMTTQWFRFSMGRNIADEDTCAINEINTRMAAANYQLNEVVQALTTSDVFLHRSLEPKK